MQNYTKEFPGGTFSEVGIVLGEFLERIFFQGWNFKWNNFSWGLNYPCRGEVDFQALFKKR